MTRKNYWGLAILILIIGVSIYLFVKHQDEIKQLEAEMLKSVELENKITQNPVADNGHTTAKPGYKWVQHGDHYHEVPISKKGATVDTVHNDTMYGVTRQGKRYKINPAHADVPAANAVPKGPPIHIDWQDGGHPPAGGRINWRDPLTWESYRNFWGFEPPKFSPKTGYEYVPTLDNWGTPLQHFNNTIIVTDYKKRIGFRPSPEQLAEYKQLQAQHKNAIASGDTLRADNLQRDIQVLMNSARGELPNTHTYSSFGYGQKGIFDDPEKEKAAHEAAERELYKRMGIEHLYEFYEQTK